MNGARTDLWGGRVGNHRLYPAADALQLTLVPRRAFGVPEHVRKVTKSMSEGPVYRRKPWQAGVLSLFVPGLGQVYNGQARKGVLLFCLYGLGVLAG